VNLAHPITNGLLPCGLPPCPEHGGLCAFHGDEPDKCPTCHASWSVILDRIATGKGQHSCEQVRNGHPESKTRSILARQRRLDATEKRYKGRRSLHCAHRVAELGRERYEPLSASQSFPEGVVMA
jgi:hypothetical protein